MARPDLPEGHAPAGAEGGPARPRARAGRPRRRPRTASDTTASNDSATRGQPAPTDIAPAPGHADPGAAPHPRPARRRSKRPADASAGQAATSGRGEANRRQGGRERRGPTDDGPTPTFDGATGEVAALSARLPTVGIADAHRIARRLDTARHTRDGEARDRALAAVATAVETAERRVAGRRAAVPAITYPETLPVSARRADIAAAIRDHQVVIVAGETGSGKTTQIPKICLELGRGVRGLIGHTQPRRLAARTVAARIAEELHTEIGEAVGWKVRFTDQVGENTLVKLMTDGILLAELAGDRMLRGYDTLIIDEAHERSLNIDFILGYLAQLLPRR
ncbi:MAG: ATP-dependent helicase HrpA, partial [Pseudonocardiales bacterium]|nr:ATP-dependent helicase HrpA [Pseudonocardiales bacterium]